MKQENNSTYLIRKFRNSSFNLVKPKCRSYREIRKNTSKDKIAPEFTSAESHEICEGLEQYLLPFLTLALDGERQASR
jgi:hypothetical protein